MSETKHSPEPWRRGEEHETMVEIETHADRLVARVVHPPFASSSRCQHFGRDPFCEMDANARRIVACVNACAGIPTEALEARALGNALGAAMSGLLAAVDDPDVLPGTRRRATLALEALRALGRLKP